MGILKVGIIGLGVGEKHIRGYEMHPACEVKALCDLSDEKYTMAKAKYPHMLITKDALDILDDPEIGVVSIASFDNYHYEQVVRALENGKHVFVEKPLCLYFEEAVDIRKCLKKHPHLRISSNLSLRTCPRFSRVREAIRSGEIGRLFYLEGDYFWGRAYKLTDGWRKDMEFYSIIYGAAVHMIDLILWITGMRPVEIQGYGNRIAAADSALRYNDFAAILMKFEDGTVAKVSANGGCVHPHFHRLAVFGTEKTFIHDLLGARWVDSSDPKVKPRDIDEVYPAKEKRGKVITTFIDSILDDRAVAIVPCDDVFDTMSVCFAAEKAVQEGKQVSITYIW